MEDARNTKENTPLESSSLSGVSLTNSASPEMSQHINGNVTTEAQHSAVDSSKLEHLKEDSHGISPEQDYPSPAGNLVTTSGKVTGTETQHSSQIAESITCIAENPEMLEPRRDARLATLSVSIPSSVLDEKPRTTFDAPSVEHGVSPRSSSNSDTLKLQHGKINESSVSIPSKDSEIKGGYPNSTKNAIHTPALSPRVRHIENENHSLPSDKTGQPLARITTHSIKSPTPINSNHPENAEKNKGIIDTAVPFRSVKQAVSKFGGIVDWKAQTVERQKSTNQELEKVQQEIPLLKKQSEAAEDAKRLVLKELDSTKHLVEQLKLDLERAQTEEQQARQDSELVKLRVEEMQQGIADESSTAAKAQLEVARARYTAAVSELKTVTSELEQLRKDYAFLLHEKEVALKKAEEAISSSKEVERTVEDLTIELITLKESLDAAHAAHLEAEEHRIGATMATEQDTLQWEKEVKQAEDELARLNQQAMYAVDLQSKLDAANALLQDLKAELTAYMESKLEQEVDNDQNLVGELVEPGKRTHGEIQSAIESTRKELDEVKLNLEKTIAEVNCLKVAATSLKSELDTEKSELSTTRQREGMASIAVASLEAELNRTKCDIAVSQMKEKEAREKMLEIPKQLQDAAQEADLAKSLAKTARDELQKTREEAEQAKAEASTIQSRLSAAEKEIEAAKASEKLAVAAINALQESESVQSTNDEESPTGVTLTLEEYYLLSKEAHQSEEQANMRVAAAISQIDIAMEAEMKSLSMLEEINNEKAVTREALELALQKAEKAKEGKLAGEQELRQWRAEHEQRRKNNEPQPVMKPTKSARSSYEDIKEPKASVLQHTLSTNEHREVNNPEKSFMQESNTETDSSSEVKMRKKKKRLFPRFLMFLTKKKSSSKTT
ncbi:PREDICTED: protein WEAK CHLOROPLAST MOVEMENT UNDER BLUE LIGHT 1-like isoform X2 [Ipomoea nil]|uniref:protein WEAK CHLOROPLAST MOVEMENT UNDER BLUE LIGHT 1-like isoform X2 n=1 Tax=Ipomoea nil TaxID=35883 RepID=UPI000901CEB2|nr:PREDICTED: protein WEAK CHLOROPLAST MOVEMENT UNDER BLUE LIGHT 1-like isoform X2 [Ipomoea nil]